MVGIRTISCAVTAVVLLLAVNGCTAAASGKLVAHKLTDAALICSKYTGADNFCATPKLTKVPYFPGTKFVISPCGGPSSTSLDRTITVDAWGLTISAKAGQDGINDIDIKYSFREGALHISTFPAFGPPTGAISTLDKWELSSLLDRSSVSLDDFSGTNLAGAYASTNRQTAIITLDIIIQLLEPFAKPNKQQVCSNFNPYNPKMAILVAYFKTVQTTLSDFDEEQTDEEEP